ncbi:MAG: hypothetical protein WCR42_14000 [bacterium]
MKKKNLYILQLFGLLLLINTFNLSSQVLESTGHIFNKGKIMIKGQATFSQDSIGGIVEYSLENQTQYIPQMVYDDVRFLGKGEKSLWDPTKKLIARTNFVTDDDSWISMVQNAEINTEGTTNHNSRINPVASYGLIKMNGLSAQDIKGHGKYKVLELDNSAGADVREQGGFKVGSQLVLTKGDFRNDATNNFEMENGTEIVRNVGASLSYEPTAGGTYNVTYQGVGSMTTGGEIPKQEGVLSKLAIHNTDSLILSKKVTVNDSIFVGTKVYTKNDTLVINSQKNPVFALANPDVEIIGSVKRTKIIPQKQYILNNPFTYVEFPDIASMSRTSSLTSTIYPDSLPEFIPTDKTKRRFYLAGYDDQGALITTPVTYKYGFGWRHAPTLSFDESNNLLPDNIKLLRWIGDRWEQYNSDLPIVDPTINWAYSSNLITDNYGIFALGTKDSFYTQFNTYAFLEGPYIENSGGKMSMNLLKRGLLKTAPPKAEYPLSLVPNYNPDDYTSVPDSVVDWVVLEFRPDRNQPASFYKLGFIKYNGEIIDLEGNSLLKVTSYDGYMLDSQYYVVLRQRNHAPIITSKSFALNAKDFVPQIDLTDPANVEGGAASMKLLEITSKNRNIYGLKAGFFVDENSIDDMVNILKTFTAKTDWEAAYFGFTKEGYLQGDYDLNGIITTNDFNYSWNNRLQ